MSDFKIVNHASEIKLTKNWIDSKNFDSEILVNRNGKQVSADYKGNKYRIIAKHERKLLPFEKCGRRFLAVLIIVVTLGHAYFRSEFVKNLLKSKECRYFGVFFGSANVVLNSVALSQKNSIFDLLNIHSELAQKDKPIENEELKKTPIFEKEKEPVQRQELKEKEKDIILNQQEIEQTIIEAAKLEEKPTHNAVLNLENELKGFKLFINCFFDNNEILVPVNIEPLDDILDIKKKLRIQLNIPVHHQRLLYLDKELEEGNTIADYNIPKYADLKLFNLRKDPDKYQIFIKTMTGKVKSMEIKSSDTILDIKKKIEFEEGIPVYQQKFIFHGKIIEDEKSAADCNIQKESTIHFYTSLRGD